MLAVDGDANQQKGDGDAATWLPPRKVFRCAYVSRQVAVKARYVLGGCTGGPESACHGIGAGGMVLPDRMPSNLVDVPSSEDPSVLRIKPGDPGGSYLYRKIIGGPDIDGGRMPLDLPPLDERSASAIAAWIEAGAPAP